MDMPPSQPPMPSPPPRQPRQTFRFERWVTILVFVGAAGVYLSLWLHSVWVFLAGELICVGTVPIIAWIERDDIRAWWRQRGRCPACGHDLRGVKGACPACGHERFGM